MSQCKKENRSKFAYPHPILRSLASVEQESLTYSPPSYQTFHTTKTETVSAKILRPSHTWPLYGRPFSLLLHPYHPAVPIPQLGSQEVIRCKKCESFLTMKNSKLISIVETKCLFCKTINQHQTHLVSHQQFPGTFDFKVYNSFEPAPRKVLVLIEVNEFLFSAKVHNTILNSLQALQNQLAE